RRDFEGRQIEKEYLTLIAGIPKPIQGVVQARLKEVEVPATSGPEKWEGQGSHHVGQRLRRASHMAKYGGGTIKKVMVSQQGQEAISAYLMLATAKTKGAVGTGKAPVDVSLVRVRIKTGRLHQIRAHMLFLGTPVLGDEIYTLATARLPAIDPPRLCLHAAHLGFKHPLSGKWLHVESPLPADLASYARKLGLVEATPSEGKNP
ncbi:MAG: pseudouridine synthase, partial [Phycisphaerae bacterium]